jgi:alpha-tubulin suppressor-like RCC1 family protein
MVFRRLVGALALAVSLLAPPAARADIATGVTILSGSQPVEVGHGFRFSATALLDGGFQRSLGRAVGIAVGDDHSCAVLADGTVYCWGDNQQGQLGDGTTPPLCFVNGFPEFASFDRLWACSNGAEVGAYLSSHASPVAAYGIFGATAVATGRSHSCALVGGMVKCWGANQAGQLGDGSTVLSSTTPVTVSGITTATAITAGAGHT